MFFQQQCVDIAQQLGPNLDRPLEMQPLIYFYRCCTAITWITPLRVIGLSVVIGLGLVPDAFGEDVQFVSCQCVRLDDTASFTDCLTESNCDSESECSNESGQFLQPNLDRLWSVSTRNITANACRADVKEPALSFYQISCDGCVTPTDFHQYIENLRQSRHVVVYVHGNRMRSSEAIRRGMEVYRRTKRDDRPAIDWVIWSWPSDKEGILVGDARRKFKKLDAQGLYLSWLLRRHVECDAPTTLIGYSFGGRVITGALHALGGGKLGGRTVPGEPITGIPFRCGLVAPALERYAMSRRGVHSMATQNLDRLVLMYNRRDAVLKRFWLVNRVRGTMALGYSGPGSFAPRFDGSSLPVFSRDCASTVGLQHSELDYYRPSCCAGREMAALIDDIFESK
ncbi:MAG: alpha/beta hydrolase [Planctomycetota bacterium]